MIPKSLNDLLCDFNYIAHSMNLVDEKLIDVPLFYSLQLVKEFCIFPMGSQFIKSNMGSNFASVLFHGFPGTGKTHAAIAVAHHTDSLFIDISPRNLEGKLNTKEETSRLLASAFRVAKNYQPVVIYFDCAEQIFPGKVKGMVKNANAQKLKRYLLSFKSLVTQDMRVLFIGCTNKGHWMNDKEMRLMFDKTIYFSLPSFSDRHKIWKTHIAKKVGRSYDLEYDVLAEISNGFSAESVCYRYIYQIDNFLYKLYTYKTEIRKG
jgi:SpoVK/Ycf46/Vps4 family AAA+-type ATPase